MNRPKLCWNATWNSQGITFSTMSTSGRSPRGIFINNRNTIYVADRTHHSIQVWLDGQASPTKTVSSDLNSPYALFVTINGDIYADNGAKKRIDMWTMNSTMSTMVINVTSHCLGLFIDIYNNLYYIVEYSHQVLKITLNDTVSSSVNVAGNISSGSTMDLLDNPHGIFVDIDLNLYVADSNNNRIQLFANGRVEGTPVAGNGAPHTIDLNYPTSVALDADAYLFIVDNGNHRLIGSGPNGYQCLAGCLKGEGADADQLSYPRSMAFDNYGNIFVTDQLNDRIQKFLLISNSCGKFNIQLMIRCS